MFSQNLDYCSCEYENCTQTFEQSCRLDKMVKSGELRKSITQRVVIIGAGIKGLFSALQLCRLGYEVTVLERTKQAGGKIKTVRSNEIINKEKDNNYAIDSDSYVEMGAMRILESHHQTLTLLNELDLEVIPYIEDNNKARFSINGLNGTVDNLNVGVLLDAGLVSSNILQSDSGLTRKSTFIEVLNHAFKNFKDILLQTYGKQINEQISVSDYLALPGRDSCVRECAATILALRNGKDGNHHAEAVDEFVNILKLHSENPLAVKGGFDQISARLIKKLKNCLILYESEVIEIEDKGSSGMVIAYKTSKNVIKTIHSDGVLIACPALHNITFVPNLPKCHRDIIEQLRTCSVPALKLVLLFDKRFWEEEEHGNVFGGTCWIAPSDINQIYLISSASSMSACSKNGYLMTYLRGNSVKRWLGKSKTDRVEKVLDEVEKLFPSAKNNVRNLYQGCSEVIWDEEGAGGYVLLNAESIRDSLTPVNRVVFSPVPRGWINDTLEDAQLAVNEIQRVLENKLQRTWISKGKQSQRGSEVVNRCCKRTSIGAK